MTTECSECGYRSDRAETVCAMCGLAGMMKPLLPSNSDPFDESLSFQTWYDFGIRQAQMNRTPADAILGQYGSA